MDKFNLTIDSLRMFDAYQHFLFYFEQDRYKEVAPHGANLSKHFSDKLDGIRYRKYKDSTSIFGACNDPEVLVKWLQEMTHDNQRIMMEYIIRYHTKPDGGSNWGMDYPAYIIPEEQYILLGEIAVQAFFDDGIDHLVNEIIKGMEAHTYIYNSMTSDQADLLNAAMGFNEWCYLSKSDYEAVERAKRGYHSESEEQESEREKAYFKVVDNPDVDPDQYKDMTLLRSVSAVIDKYGYTYPVRKDNSIEMSEDIRVHVNDITVSEWFSKLSPEDWAVVRDLHEEPCTYCPNSWKSVRDRSVCKGCPVFENQIGG